MPGWKVTSGVALVTLLVGISLGTAHEPEQPVKTETRFIKVPTVETKIEYRDKYLPMPEECMEIGDVLVRIQANDRAQAEQAGIILLASQDLATGTATNDISQVNEQSKIIRDAKEKLGLIVNERADDIAFYQVKQAACNDALDGSE